VAGASGLIPPFTAGVLAVEFARTPVRRVSLLQQESFCQREAGMRYAGFWKRFAAVLIDGVLLGVAGFVVGLVLVAGMLAGGAGDLEEAAAGAGAISNLVGLLIGWFYYAFMESSPSQATLGKMALGIRVTDASGMRIGFGKATGRYFAKFISALILGIGFLMAAFTEKKQGLHDLMAGTLVVNK
jgi:uncharacterized RDD family membrane protein YckC